MVRLKVKHIDSAQNIIRIEQSKGRKSLPSRDRYVMLSPDTLDLLRQWWKARPSRYDAGAPIPERWLFPGYRHGKPMTTRQLSRLFHQAADAAGIKKAVTLSDQNSPPYSGRKGYSDTLKTDGRSRRTRVWPRHPGRAARSIENRECPKPATGDCEQH